MLVDFQILIKDYVKLLKNYILKSVFLVIISGQFYHIILFISHKNILIIEKLYLYVKYFFNKLLDERRIIDPKTYLSTTPIIQV